jgi:hypothetical protein
MPFAPPSPPFVAAKHFGGKQTPRLIVLHSTVSACKPGMARVIARFFRIGRNVTSAHYVVDPGEVYQMVGDHTVAFHCGYNQDSIGVEMCDMPVRFLSGRWLDDNHQAMLKRTANLVAQLCLAYDIPVVWRGGRNLLRNKNGITTHNQMSRVFKRSTHWDPGSFPRRQFMAMVRAEVARLSADAEPVTLRVTLANIKSTPLMPNDWVEDDIKKVAATKANIYMGQEITPTFYKAAWRNLLPERYQHWGLRHENAVSVGPRFHVTAHATPKRSPGWTGVQPTRFDTVVETTHQGLKIAVVNMHTISEAWTHDDDTTDQRQLLWERHLAATRKEVARLQKAGFFVLVGGDLNNPKPTKVGEGQVLLVNEGLLQLYVCPPGGGTAHLEAIQRIKGHTDHPILAIKLTLEK